MRCWCSRLLALVQFLLLLSSYSLLLVEIVGFWDTCAVSCGFWLAGWEEGATGMSVALVVGVRPELRNLCMACRTLDGPWTFLVFVAILTGSARVRTKLGVRLGMDAERGAVESSWETASILRKE